MSEQRYTTREAAAVLGVPDSTLRRLLRSGVIRATERRGRTRLLAFADLVAAKAACELAARGVSVRKMRRALAALAHSLPHVDRPLSRLRVVSDGESLAVLGDDGAFEPRSGQTIMEFAIGELGRRAAEVLPLAAGAAASRRASRAAAPSTNAAHEVGLALFREALALDAEGRDADAEHLYRAALDVEPDLAAAHTNLGAIAFRAGRRGDARARFDAALALDPEQPEARFDLANLLHALGEREAAIAEWARAAALAPGFPDAHYNLGVALARAGEPLAARVSLTRYLALCATGEAAAHARSLHDALANLA